MRLEQGRGLSWGASRCPRCPLRGVTVVLLRGRSTCLPLGPSSPNNKSPGMKALSVRSGCIAHMTWPCFLLRAGKFLWSTPEILLNNITKSWGCLQLTHSICTEVETAIRFLCHLHLKFSHSIMSDSLWPHGLQHARLPFTNSQGLLKLMSIELVMPSYNLILCRPLLLLPSIFPSIRVFSSESALCIRWPKYWSFSISISPSNEYSGLISFRMDWLDLFAVQGTFKSLLQHHSSKASILWCLAFFMVQLSHPYMTTGKIIALTTDLCRQSNVSAF